MALGDKVEELQRAAATLMERLDNTLKTLDTAHAADMRTAQQRADLRREYDKEVALRKREIEELKKWKDDRKKQGEEWSRRLWAFGPNALAAVINVVLAAAVAYFVSRRP